MDFDAIVLSGGGLSGFSQLGFLKELQEANKLTPVRKFFGTSIGALIATCTIVGIPVDKIMSKLMVVDDKLLKVGDLSHLFTKYGLDDGEFFMATIIDLFLENGVNPLLTFAGLVSIKKQLFISVVNLSRNKVEYFSHLTVPNMKILDAVRVSISIPILLDSKQVNGEYYVDGGLLDNYPMEIAKMNSLNPIGCFTETMTPVKINSFETFMYNLAVCTLCKSHPICDKTVFVSNTATSSFNFNADVKTRESLFIQGRISTKNYLAQKRRVKLRRKSI